MRRAGLAAALSASALAAALPNNPGLQAQLQAQWATDSDVHFPCSAHECRKPTKMYQRILNAQPGVQWMDHGGYCGAWSVQRAAMTKGAWISQQQVRNHTVPGGGHDEEILDTNIELALANLKLKFEGFDYKHLPTPQADAYRKWMKAKLASGHALVWMIMLQGEKYPVYPGLEYGFYGHVEPVVGILSDRPLNDTEWYDDDYVVHYTDADEHAYYRSMSSLTDGLSQSGPCARADYVGYPCVYEKYGIGWAIEGLQDAHDGRPLSLTVVPSRSEPNTRLGGKPIPLIGTVTIEELVENWQYAIYRWDSVASAFDYTKPRSVHRFTATGPTEVFKDPISIPSDGTVYYRCVVDSETAVVV